MLGMLISNPVCAHVGRRHQSAHSLTMVFAEDPNEDCGGRGGGGGRDQARPSSSAHSPLQPQRPDREKVSTDWIIPVEQPELTDPSPPLMCLVFSHLEVDPLYIAYADMMAKV